MQRFYTATGFMTKTLLCLFTMFIVWPATLAGLLLASYMAFAPISLEGLLSGVVDSVAELQALGPATEGSINYMSCDSPSTIVPLSEANVVPAVRCDSRIVVAITKEQATQTVIRFLSFLYFLSVILAFVVYIGGTGRLFPFFTGAPGFQRSSPEVISAVRSVEKSDVSQVH